MKKLQSTILKFQKTCIDHSELIMFFGICIFWLISCSYISFPDLTVFDCTVWTDYMKEHGFLAIYHGLNSLNFTPSQTYANASSINYPPIYPLYLYLISFLYDDPFSLQCMVLVKAFTIIPYVCFTIFIYRHISRKAAFMYAMNVAVLTNTFLWSQRDGVIFGLCIILYYYIKHNNKWAVSSIFVISILLKPQCMYFIPIYLLYLCVKLRFIRSILTQLLYAGGICLSAFLPFMIKERSLLLPLYVYTGNVNLVSSTTNNTAPNIWYLLGSTSITVKNFGLISASIILFCMMLFIVVYTQTKNFAFSSIVYMYTAFMIGFGQDSRYGIYILMMMFIAIYVYTPIDTKLLKLYMIIYGLTNITVSINQLAEYSAFQYFSSFAFMHGLDDHDPSIISQIPFYYEIGDGFIYLTLTLSFVMIFIGIFLFGKVYNRVLELRKDLSNRI